MQNRLFLLKTDSLNSQSFNHQRVHKLSRTRSKIAAVRKISGFHKQKRILITNKIRKTIRTNNKFFYLQTNLAMVQMINTYLLQMVN